MRISPLAFVASSLCCLPACWEQPLTYEEELLALTESAASHRAESLTSEIIEITTSFTLGGALQDAAAEVADFVRSQISCSTVSWSEASVTVDFGVLDDECTWNGRTYAGVAMVSVTEMLSDLAVVSYTWTGLTDGQVTLSGGSTVSWSGEAGTRTVDHEFTWSDPDRSDTLVTGTRTQSLVDPSAGISAGIRVEGQRAWTTDEGTWQLVIEGIEMRGRDPLPQAGRWVVQTPSSKTAELSFLRIDEDTIEVRLTGGRAERVWRVTAEGMEAVDDGEAA